MRVGEASGCEDRSYELGRLAHIVSDLCQPQHTDGRQVNPREGRQHQWYESYVDRGLEREFDFSGCPSSAAEPVQGSTMDELDRDPRTKASSSWGTIGPVPRWGTKGDSLGETELWAMVRRSNQFYGPLARLIEEDRFSPGIDRITRERLLESIRWVSRAWGDALHRSGMNSRFPWPDLGPFPGLLLILLYLRWVPRVYPAQRARRLGAMAIPTELDPGSVDPWDDPRENAVRETDLVRFFKSDSGGRASNLHGAPERQSSFKQPAHKQETHVNSRNLSRGGAEAVGHVCVRSLRESSSGFDSAVLGHEEA